MSDAPDPRRWGEVLRVALWLGLTSFGGPVAHIGYFERVYVRRLGWIAADDFAGLVALCQMLPGPASSQLGWLVGLRRAGWRGALAAWAGFTLPSALLMTALAMLAGRLDMPLAAAVLHGLQLVAVAVVAHAVWSMARTMCPDAARAAIALVAGALALAIMRPGAQLAVMLWGAIAGAWLCRGLAPHAPLPRVPVGPRAGLAALAAFVALLIWAMVPAGHDLPGLAAHFVRAGALVFGGGHVVLPLLRNALVPAGWIDDARFLQGYGLAQAMPGPMFAFAAWLGAAAAPPGLAPAWAGVALVAMFLPGVLAATAGAPLWRVLIDHPQARGAMAGVNAAVVGLLGAALVNPVIAGAIRTPVDGPIALVLVVLLLRWRAPPLVLVVLAIAGSVLARSMALL